MGEPTSIQVIDRMASLLDIMARYDDAVSLKILSAESGLHPSTTYRILASLSEHHYVERNKNGSYRLGFKLLHLGSHVRQRVDLRQQAIPIMARLRDQLGETVNLTVKEGDEVVYVEKATPNRMMHVQQLIGSRAPLHVTAAGKLMLAMGGEDECRGYALRTNLPAYTRNTINNLPKLLNEAERLRGQGYAYDDEEAEIGVGCIGTLIYDATGNIVAGLSVSAPIERRKAEWISNLRRAASEISEALGYRAA